MAKFLVTVWPFASHYFPLVAVARALRAQGHEVRFYTGKKARPVLDAEGFASFPFTRIDEQRVDEIMFSQSIYSSRRRPVQLQALLREWLLGTLPQQVTDLTAVLAEWQPDVVVSETSMMAPMLVLRERDEIPVAVFSTVAACLLPGPDAPPYGMGLPRPHNVGTRLLASAVRMSSTLLGAKFRRTADELRGRYGLPPLDVSVTEYTGAMPLYLVPNVPEFDYNRHDLPPSVHYVGPCIWNKPNDVAAPGWLAELPAGRPVVHVTEGTMHTDKPLVLRAAAQGLADLPMDVVMTTGGNRRPDELDLGPVASNVRIEGWISHSDLLPRTDVVVTTGGAGTVMAVLAAGVPMIVVPTEWDKPENAQRVVAAGAGLRLSPQRCTPQRMQAAVEQILGDPSFRHHAGKMAQVLARYDGPANAAQLLGRLAASGSVHEIHNQIVLEPRARTSAPIGDVFK